MNWTPEQRAILDHPLDAHAVVRAVPGAGKTTTLVGRVIELCRAGVDPKRIRVVMFNKSVQLTFEGRLVPHGLLDVNVTTFDALGLEVLRKANERKLIGREFKFMADGTRAWASRAKSVLRWNDVESSEEIADAVNFWKAHLIPPERAASKEKPKLVEAYRFFEMRRQRGNVLRCALEDLVYEAVGIVRAHPHILGDVDHILVDEFQDVNPARVELVRGLMGPQTVVMAVGDEDQSINEWCGAHPRFFLSFERYFPDKPTRVYPLSQSFRFGPTIAEAANLTISQNKERRPVTVVGGGKTPGRIETTTNPSATVERLIARGVPPSDIAVLYRSRAQGAGPLAGLVAKRVPLRTDDSHVVREGFGPELAFSFLHHAASHGPVDFEAAWKFVHGEKRFVRKEAFAEQVDRRGSDGLRAVLRDEKAGRAAGQNPGAMRTLRNLADMLDAMARCKAAGKALTCVPDVVVRGSLAAWVQSERERLAAAAAFDAVRTLLRNLDASLEGARAALDGIDVTRGAALDDQVWCSTIHKAKGLEWRHVVLPWLVEGATPAKGGPIPLGTLEEPTGVAQTDWLEQERRIFYVGFTRAIETAWLHTPGENPSRFVSELFGETWSPTDGPSFYDTLI